MRKAWVQHPAAAAASAAIRITGERMVVPLSLLVWVGFLGGLVSPVAAAAVELLGREGKLADKGGRVESQGGVDARPNCTLNSIDLVHIC